jgi:MFS transporter, DHA2 family, multidrug resistance protein
LLTGLVLLAATLYEMELFTDSTGALAIVGTSLVQGLALGLLFVPLSTIAFLTIGSELRTDGTAMLTLIRNVFSSVGISVVIAQLTNSTIVMHARLAESVTPFNNALQMPNVTGTIDLATDAGRMLLDSIMTQQATIIAYANNYKLMLILALAAMPMVLFVGSSRQVRSVRSEVTHAMD